MAPEPPSTYFPPLRGCLGGDYQLVSWKSAYRALCHVDAAEENLALHRFLTSSESIDMLKEPLSPSGPPTDPTKSDFDAFTSQIQITPSAIVREIKDDAIWLSGEAGVEQLFALRIVVLEWQDRAAAQLRNGLTEAETLVLRDAGTSANFGRSTLRAGASLLGQSVRASDTDTFNTERSRRKRQFETYIEERAHTLKVSELLVRIHHESVASVSGHDGGKGKGRAVQSWILELGDTLTQAQRGRDQHGGARSEHSSGPFTVQCVSALEHRLTTLAEPDAWPPTVVDYEDLAGLWATNLFAEALSVMQLFFTYVDSYVEPSPVATSFAQSLAPLFQSLVATISLLLLKLPQSLAHLRQSITEQDGVSYPQLGDKPYVDDDACVKMLHTLLTQAAGYRVLPASPAMFAWSLIAQNIRTMATEAQLAREDTLSAPTGPMTSIGIYEPGGRTQWFEDTSRMLLEVFNEMEIMVDPIVYLAKAAVDEMQVYQLVIDISSQLCTAYSSSTDRGLAIRSRVVLMELIREGLPLTAYGEDLAQSVITLLTGNDDDWVAQTEAAKSALITPVQYLVADGEIFRPQFLGQAFERYPYEIHAALQLLRVFAKSGILGTDGNLLATVLLEENSHLTMRFHQDFRDYELVNEDENTSSFQLTADIPLFAPRKLTTTSRRRSRASNTAADYLWVPAGTTGSVINETRPFMVRLDFSYSGMLYLSTLLSTRIPRNNLISVATQSEVDRQTAVEIVRLLSALINPPDLQSDEENGKRSPHGAALISLRNGVWKHDQSTDLVGMVFEILEDELQTQIEHPGLENSHELLVACIEFITAALQTFPARIWPLLSRSKLLSVDQGRNGLALVIASTEIAISRYPFLTCCIKLFEALIRDAVTRCVSAYAPTKAPTRFGSSNAAASNTPDRITARVLIVFERTLLDVFQSSISWKFVTEEERLEISKRILESYTKILECVYGIDDASDPAQKITKALAPAAEHLVVTFLPQKGNDLILEPLLGILTAGVMPLASTVPLAFAELWTSHLRAALSFANTVIQVGALHGVYNTNLQARLFKAMPVLVRLFVADSSYRAPVASLLTTLVTCAGQSEGEPASLLGCLGSSTAKCFLTVLSEIDCPLSDPEVEIELWKLLSAVLSNKQQWFAIYLLTGTTPRDKLKSADTSEASQGRGKPLLAYALEQLSKIKELSPQRAMAMLEFVSLAQNFWGWATQEIRRHERFIKNILEWLDGITPNNRADDLEATVRSANENRMAAYIAHILATFLHNARQMGEKIEFDKIRPNLKFFMDHGVDTSGYIQTQFSTNFSNKFPLCSLTSVKRTLLRPKSFGRHYYYDLDIAAEAFGHDVSWAGITKGKGFVDEMIRANVNLSLVESKVLRLKSWKTLAIELSHLTRKGTQKHELQSDFAKVIVACLEANSASRVPQKLFEELIAIRADLAFVLMQQLVAAKSSVPEINKMFGVAWETIRTCGFDFEVGLAGPNADYYRILLRILLLALQPHLYLTSAENQAAVLPNGSALTKSSGDPVLITLLLEVLLKVVAMGIRNLCSTLHARPQEVDHTDFVILTAFLQSMLRVPGMQNQHHQIAAVFMDNNTIRYTTSLFSWSDQVATALETADPIYAEISTLFLLELSAVPLLADKMACEGVLSQLSTANVTGYLRRPIGSGPFDEPVRMFSVWSKGILPFCLNLLDTVGAPVAAEIANFLNSFPHQLKRAQSSLENLTPTPRQPHAGSITLGIASEAHSLALIWRVLEHLRAAGAAEGVVPAKIPQLLWGHAGVREDLEALFPESRATLREKIEWIKHRVVPTGDREMAMAERRGAVVGLADAEGGEGRLVGRVVVELEQALMCLSGAI
ncbi:hypothetical protein LTR66_005381 [Elasticomyces elasticus]|nr:hypothetical protein LTR66_005381 [Elasticomyces elasticus]